MGGGTAGLGGGVSSSSTHCILIVGQSMGFGIEGREEQHAF